MNGLIVAGIASLAGIAGVVGITRATESTPVEAAPAAAMESAQAPNGFADRLARVKQAERAADAALERAGARLRTPRPVPSAAGPTTSTVSAGIAPTYREGDDDDRVGDDHESSDDLEGGDHQRDDD